MHDPVNRPAHYNQGKIEVIEFIEDQQLGYHLGNAIKYICRAGKKDKDKEVEDLRKAIWYIERHIASKRSESIKDFVGRLDKAEVRLQAPQSPFEKHYPVQINEPAKPMTKAELDHFFEEDEQWNEQTK